VTGFAAMSAGFRTTAGGREEIASIRWDKADLFDQRDHLSAGLSRECSANCLGDPICGLTNRIIRKMGIAARSLNVGVP
jgi:hypothetical protein